MSAGKVGEEYLGSIETTGSVEMSHSIVDGKLPDGLEFLNSTTIHGIPTKSGSFKFKLRINAVDGSSDTKEISITILKNPDIKKPSIDGTFAAGTINEPYSSKIYASILLCTDESEPLLLAIATSQNALPLR